ncbi:PC4/YdbC family ssDNA-binding protein [Gemmobacter sp. 24YEA27]|uniref:transcriptional coactivator p15/PC4 family protein n=1 Tax=Gemmobacter sp. 24YEA27 TaxID=3040672 RepID=UPI0024B39FCF|nr:PC4/YdbC family ssDNA-binding protein [Gemmobacter sp. 24YEA27]
MPSSSSAPLPAREYGGHQLFNARVFFEAQDGGMRPGKAGVAFQLDALPEFARAVTAALDEAQVRGLVK